MNKKSIFLLFRAIFGDLVDTNTDFTKISNKLKA